jgi:coatomer subunit beta
MHSAFRALLTFALSHSSTQTNTSAARPSASSKKITKEVELLEPLISTCRVCLEHCHGYVGKNAVFAVYAIYRELENLDPDTPELMATFLVAESDPTCERNAFVFLAHASMERAMEYVLSLYDT